METEVRRPPLEGQLDEALVTEPPDKPQSSLTNRGNVVMPLDAFIITVEKA